MFNDSSIEQILPRKNVSTLLYMNYHPLYFATLWGLEVHRRGKAST